MRRNTDYKILQKYKKKQFILICILTVFLISIGAVLGRYVVDNVDNFINKSREFYFNSDKLAENTPNYQIENWSGVDDYTITVNMDSRENNLLVASYDIGYEISYICSDNIICQLSKTEGTIYATTNTDFFNLLVTPNAQFKIGDKAFVQIIAKATTPYKKTIKADFTFVVGQESLTYEIEDEATRPYLLLNITNTIPYYIIDEAFSSYNVGDKINQDTYLALADEEKLKCHSSIITIEFDPNEIVLDMTNQNYLNATQIETQTKEGYQYIKGMTFRMDAVSSTTIRFYKMDSSKDYTYPIVNTVPVITLTSR